MSVVSASKSLTVMDACPALHSSRQEWEPKRNAAVLCFLGTSPVFRSLVMSATNSPLSSMATRRRSSVRRLAVMASASEWEQEQQEKEEGEGFDEVPEAAQQFDQEGAESYEEGSEPYEPYVEPPEGAKLFVGNLPFDVDSEQLAGVFEKAGIVEVVEVPWPSLNIMQVQGKNHIAYHREMIHELCVYLAGMWKYYLGRVIYDRETNRSRGFAFVSMSTVEEAEKAIEMFHQYELSGRRLTVNKAAPRGSRVDRPPRFGGEAGSSNRLYVGNLPWGADDARLGELFSEHGKVLEARIVYDRETGRSRGFGFVTLSSPEEVDDAIASLDGADFEGRPLRVNVAEERPRRSF